MRATTGRPLPASWALRLGNGQPSLSLTSNATNSYKAAFTAKAAPASDLQRRWSFLYRAPHSSALPDNAKAFLHAC